jgi:hypothetical protein
MLCETIGYDYQEIKVDVQDLFETVYLPFVTSHGDENGVLPNTLHLPNDDITTTPRHPYSIEPVKYFVMCDLILDRVYGPTRRNILRIVEVPSPKKFGEQISITYDNPQYIEIKKNSFNKIEIKMRKYISHQKNLEDSGEHIVEFQSGLLLLTLHFRKKSNEISQGIVIPVTKPRRKNADFVFIESTIQKIKYKNEKGIYVPFSCNPLKYMTCKPLEPREIKNEELIHETLATEPQVLIDDNDDSKLQQKKEEKWIHLFSSTGNISETSRMRYNIYKMELQEDVLIESIKPALENSILVTYEIIENHEENTKTFYACYETEESLLPELERQKVKRDTFPDYQHRDIGILQKLSKSYCDNKAKTSKTIITTSPELPKSHVIVKQAENIEEEQDDVKNPEEGKSQNYELSLDDDYNYILQQNLLWNKFEVKLFFHSLSNEDKAILNNNIEKFIYYRYVLQPSKYENSGGLDLLRKKFPNMSNEELIRSYKFFFINEFIPELTMEFEPIEKVKENFKFIEEDFKILVENQNKLYDPKDVINFFKKAIDDFKKGIQITTLSGNFAYDFKSNLYSDLDALAERAYGKVINKYLKKFMILLFKELNLPIRNQDETNLETNKNIQTEQ